MNGLEKLALYRLKEMLNNSPSDKTLSKINELPSADFTEEDKVELRGHLVKMMEEKIEMLKKEIKG